MFKWFKNLFAKGVNKEESFITASLFMKADEVEFKDFKDYIYDTDKFKKWFNSFPFVWLSFDRKRFEVGCKAKISFTFPPFTYSMVVTNVSEDSFDAVSSGGLLTGKTSMKFTRNEEGILLEDPHWLSGINVFFHKYYSWFLAPMHVPYMKYRYYVLKKMILKEKKKKMEGKV